MYRADATPNPQMVQVFEDTVFKKNVFPSPPSGPRQGSDWQTFLTVKAWVKNVAYNKKVWVDVHVFDSGHQLIHAETLTLCYVGPADGFPRRRRLLCVRWQDLPGSDRHAGGGFTETGSPHSSVPALL